MPENLNIREKILRLLNVLLVVQSVAVFLYILFLPADPKNAWLLGMSKARWVMLGGAAVLFSIVSFPFVASRRRPAGLERVTRRLLEWLNSLFGSRLALYVGLAATLVGVWFARYWAVHAGDQFLQAYLTRFAPFVFFLSLAGFELLVILPWLRLELKTSYLAFGFAVLCVGGVLLFTNHLPVEGMPWDVKYYYLLAERGFEGQNIAPYVYRYATPFLARGLAELFYLPIYGGYTVVALVGGVLQLLSVYWLVQYIGGGLRVALAAMLTTALAMFNLKFLLFDVSRPDHLAYFLMTIAVLAMLSDQVIRCALITAIGLQFREHLAIPPFIMGVHYLRLWWRNIGQMTWLGRCIILVLATGLAVLLPRALIPVVDNTQFVDPQKPASLMNLIGLPLDLWRDTNFLFCILAYILPTLLLLTRHRARQVWEKMQPFQFFLILYTATVLFLSLYGGHDMTRYSTYLFIPQAIFIAVLAESSVPRWEWIYMFVAVAVFNRIFMHIPVPLQDFDKYLDFYGGYANRVNISSLLRWVEWLGYIGGAVLIRWIITKRGEKSDGRTLV